MITAPRLELPTAALLAAVLLTAGCEEERTLIVLLVPNPEVNTRADVAERVTRLEVELDAEGGFVGLDAGDGDAWGPYAVADVDDDGDLELVLSRQGSAALEPFELSQGHQGGRVLHLTARGYDEAGRLTALGGVATAFGGVTDNWVEVPFNLLPDQRPLRVLSMSPPDGSRGLESPFVGDVLVQLGGHVTPEAIAGRLVLRAVGTGEEIREPLRTSYVSTSLGRTTAVWIPDCTIGGGDFEVEVETGVCTTAGSCLDQHLGLEGDQPFVGRFSVDGAPSTPICDTVIEVESTCPATPCEEGFECLDGECLRSEEGTETVGVEQACDPTMCAAPTHRCDEWGACVPDCTFWGACPDAGATCDEATGACVEGAP